MTKNCETMSAKLLLLQL